VLKKAGLIAAASVASLVAVSPLAHAGGIGDDVHAVDGVGAGHDGQNKDKDGHGHHSDNQNSHGLVNVGNGNNINVPMQLCNNDVQGQVGAVPIQDVGENPTLSPLNGALGLFGGAEANQHSHTTNARTCGQDATSAGYGNN
jgi:hypothetical protein